MSGVINGTAPNPVRLAEMCAQLGTVMGRPSWLPVPDIALKAILGEGATVVRIYSFSPKILFFHYLCNRILLQHINCDLIAGLGRAAGGSC